MLGKHYTLVITLALSACSGKKVTAPPAGAATGAAKMLTPAPPVPIPTAAPAPTPVEPAPLPVSVPGPDVLAAARAAWQQRLARPALEQAIALWEQQLSADPNDSATATNIAHGYYFLADAAVTLTPQDDSITGLYEKGVRAAEHALLAYSADLQARVKAGTHLETSLQGLPPITQAALYWYAANLGRYAMGRGLTTMLFYQDRILVVMQHVLSIDETFYYGAPHRYFGAYYAKLPTFAGGDLRKSKEHFERAQHISNDFFATKVLWAETYAVRAEDRVLFRSLLTDVLHGDPNALGDILAEQHLEQEKARRLLARTDELF